MQRHLEVRKHGGYKYYYKEWGQNRAVLESISSHYLSMALRPSAGPLPLLSLLTYTQSRAPQRSNIERNQGENCISKHKRYIIEIYVIPIVF